MDSDFKPFGNAKRGTVTYAENERNVYTSVCLKMEANTEVVVIPLADYLKAREILEYEAGFSVNEVGIALGFWE